MDVGDVAKNETGLFEKNCWLLFEFSFFSPNEPK